MTRSRRKWEMNFSVIPRVDGSSKEDMHRRSCDLGAMAVPDFDAWMEARGDDRSTVLRYAKDDHSATFRFVVLDDDGSFVGCWVADTSFAGRLVLDEATKVTDPARLDVVLHRWECPGKDQHDNVVTGFFLEKRCVLQWMTPIPGVGRQLNTYYLDGPVSSS